MGQIVGIAIEILVSYIFLNSVLFRVFISMKDPIEGDTFLEFHEAARIEGDKRIPRLVLAVWVLTPLLITAVILRSRQAS